MVKKQDQRLIEGELEEQPKLHISNKMKKNMKIKPDGPFQGKNRQILGADGKALSTIDAIKQDQSLQITTEQEARKASTGKSHETFIERV